MNKFNKYLYIFIFSILSILVFVMNVNECSSVYLNNNWIVNFFSEIYYSLKPFDILYVTLYIFILYFYSNVYFDDKKKYKNKIISMIIAIIFSIVTLVGKTYMGNISLNILFSSLGQIFKTIVYISGYYLIYYAIIKMILNIKISNIKVKKKDH